jgi:hypothetical protein
MFSILRHPSSVAKSGKNYFLLLVRFYRQLGQKFSREFNAKGTAAKLNNINFRKKLIFR